MVLGQPSFVANELNNLLDSTLTRVPEPKMSLEFP